MATHPASAAQLPLTEELTAVFARMSGLLLAREPVQTVLELGTSLAVQAVPGASGAGITLVHEDGRRMTSAATDPLVERADALQYEFDEGPCLAAAAEQQLVRIDDLGEDQRWPRWADVAGALGLRASLSAPLVAGDRSLGAVKVYADRPGTFDRQAEQVLVLFAAQAALLIASARSHEDAARLSEDLREAVRSRDLVHLATGVLMCRHGVDEDTAAGLLLARAAEDAVPLREAAGTILAAQPRRQR